jgi:acetyl-CoA carboxylase carboxyl transferase subunit beta
MEELFKARKEKLKVFKSLRQKAADENVRKDVPDGMYTKCEACGETHLTIDLEKHIYVCPNCQQHLKMPARKRLQEVFDYGKYKELYTNLKTNDPLQFPGYQEKIENLQKVTGLDEAVLVGSGRIGGQKTIVCVMDSRFLMGSMGYVVGEKITRGIEHATKRRRPLVIFTTSGGARMQEGIISLMQMAKTSSALARHNEAGLLYISYITHPTTGGVTASFATLGDIIIGEPKALIGFAGPRVIESTIKQQLPEGFQRTEFMQEQGFIDCIWERKDMKTKLSLLIKMHSKGGQ